SLTADLGEERRERIVIVHGPAFERVIVALSALNLDAHEDLGDIFGHGGWFGFNEIEVCGGFGEVAAGGREEFAGEFVYRFVVPDGGAQPVVVAVHAFRVERV